MTVVIMMATIVSGVGGDANDIVAAQSVEMPEQPSDTHHDSVLTDAHKVPVAGTLSEAPQVPQTIPVRRIMPTTTGGFSLLRIIRLCCNLTTQQLAAGTDRILNSLCSCYAEVFAGAMMPFDCTRSCEYYVYALRMIVI